MKRLAANTEHMEALSAGGRAKTAGTWWNDQSIELVRIDGEIYALNGWNGELWADCWKTDGTNVTEDGIEIRPVYVGDLIPQFWETHEEDGSDEWELGVQIADYEITTRLG